MNGAVAIPHSRVYWVFIEEYISDADAPSEAISESELVFETVDGPRTIGDRESRLVEPLVYEPRTKHWKCVHFNPWEMDDGQRLLFTLKIPQERVYYVNRASDEKS